MDELTIKIVMLLFPGIICTILLDKILEHKPWGNFKYSLLIIFYGVLSYCFLQMVYVILHFFKVGWSNFDFTKVEMLSAWQFSDGNLKNLPYLEILCAGIIAALLACIVSYIERKEWIISILRKLNITEKYGDYTTTYQLLKNNRNQWIDITIWDKSLFIRGIVISINETNGLCELCISDAEVFAFTKDGMRILYFVDFISISESYSNLIISTTQQPREV